LWTCVCCLDKIAWIATRLHQIGTELANPPKQIKETRRFLNTNHFGSKEKLQSGVGIANLSTTAQLFLHSQSTPKKPHHTMSLRSITQRGYCDTNFLRPSLERTKTGNVLLPFDRSVLWLAMNWVPFSSVLS